MERRTFLGGAAAAGIALRGTPAHAAASFRLIVTETEAPLVPNSVEWLALSLGYFKRAGVDVELVKVQQSPSAVAALHSGGGEMANISTDIALQLIGRGQISAHGVVSPDKALPYVIAAKRSLTSPKDIEGKVYGVARIGSVDYETSRAVLATLGVNVDRVRYLAVGQPAVRAQALLAGQIDATTISLGVFTTLADTSGLNVLVDQNAFFKAAPFISKINVVPDDVAKSRGAEVLAVVKAVILASRDFARKPSVWIDAMAAARPDVTRPQLTALAAAYRKSWSVNGGLNLAQLKFTTDALYRGPDFADLKRVEPSSWIDTRYADTVLKAAGVDPLADTPGR